jgi:hypothetical protein
LPRPRRVRASRLRLGKKSLKIVPESGIKSPGVERRRSSMITLTRLSSLIAAAAVLFGPMAVTAGGLPGMQADYVARYEPVLRAVPNLELPAKAASLVKQARLEQKEVVAIAVVRVVSKINPAAIPPVVGAIGRAEPSVAARAAAEAGKLQPKLRRDITTAIALQQPGVDSGPVPTERPLRVGNPVPTERPIKKPIPVPNPEPTDRGKHKGHYKNP